VCRIARQSKRAQPRSLFNDRAALGLVFRHGLLAVLQLLLFLLEQRFGTFPDLIRMHVLSMALDVICSLGTDFGAIPVIFASRVGVAGWSDDEHAMTMIGAATTLPAANTVENESPNRPCSGPIPNAATPYPS
jgi:hypothetical protein